jgi:peptidyl-prolyl cis-trans isomerase A (cyclophilin A)
VTDAQGATGTATVEVIINGDPLFGLPPDFGTGQASVPVARAGDDRDYGAGDPVELDGAASSGAELRYSWIQTDGDGVGLTGTDQAVATFTAPALGADNAYMFELTVTDAFGRVATDVVTVTVVERPEVQIDTTLGSFTVRLEPGRAPKTVANFLQYVEDDFYPGTIFHRVISDFVIQGGGFEPGLEQKVTRAPIELEADNGLSNTRGTIAMARTSEPNSAAAQFYVNLVDNSADLDPSDNSPGYTVFGEVISGLDVVDAIAAVDTETVDGFENVPETDVVITDVSRVN